MGQFEFGLLVSRPIKIQPDPLLGALFYFDFDSSRRTRGGALHLGAVVEAGVPTAAALRGEIEEVPDGGEQVDAASWMSGAIQGCAV